MKKLLLLNVISLLAITAFAQNTKLVIPIVKTGETYIDIEEEINGEDVVVDSLKISISSDDAEQENDEMDTLIDDDIDAGWEGDDFNALLAGLRFQNITIPKGATIDSAFIIVTSHEAKAAEDICILSIYADARVNAPTFSMDHLISDRTSTTSKVEWTIDEEWGLYTTHSTSDIKNIVQEMVDKAEWTSGNPIAFILANAYDEIASELDNAREFEAFENIADPEDGGDGMNHPERVPQLVIYYTAPSYELVIPIVKTGETYIDIEEEINGEDVVVDSLKIDISSDDAEQENDEMDTLIDDDIDAGWEGDDFNALTAGIRFQNVTIPQGANITSAHITLTSHEAKAAEDVTILDIYTDDVANAPTFNMDNLISSRTYSDTKVEWTVDEEWGLYTQHNTPELKSLVQAMVNRQDWASGNALAFIFANGYDEVASELDNAREWESFENIADPEDGGDGMNHPERVPTLRVTFTLGGSATGLSSAKTVSDLFSAYPNPTNDILNIALNDNKAATISIFNQVGQLVTKVYSNQAIEAISTDNLSAGIYFVQVEQGSLVQVDKIIKK